MPKDDKHDLAHMVYVGQSLVAPFCNSSIVIPLEENHFRVCLFEDGPGNVREGRAAFVMSRARLRALAELMMKMAK